MTKQKIIAFYRSAWLFPTLIAVVMVGLAIFKIHGSSVGMYNQFFYGKDYHDQNLLFGQPRSIRSDEWLVVTPTVVAQTQNNLEPLNPNIGYGEDLSVVLDTPHKNWSAIFQPQNWAFFVLPLEHAFALKWWMLLAALIVSCYFFILTLLPRQKLFAVLIALGFAFAPYVQWWYQSITILSLVYGFVIATLLLKLWHSPQPRSKLLWSICLGYALTCFALLQYPPYLIPIGVAVAAFFAGHILDHWAKTKNFLRKNILYIIIPAASAVGLIALFWASHASILQLVTNTAYPGKRSSEALSLNIWELLGGFLSARLQDAQAAAHYFSNQSEAANFILLSPLLLLPSAYIIYRAFKTGSKHKYTLLFLNVVLILFSVRFLTQINGEGVAAALRIVPNNRILLGIGFVGILQMVVLARDQQSIAYPKKLVKWGVIFGTLALVYIGWRLKHDFPGYIQSGSSVLVVSAAISAAFYFFMKKRLAAAALLVLTVSFLATYKVNPLYRGLSPITDSPLSRSVKSINDQAPGPWIVLDSLEYNTYLPAQGIQTISGVYTYPQFALWQKIDQEKKYVHVYNRYAQAVFSDYAPDIMYLVQSDMFHLKFNGCSDFVQKESAYILSVHPTSTECLAHVKTLELPNKTFYIYKTPR